MVLGLVAIIAVIGSIQLLFPYTGGSLTCVSGVTFNSTWVVLFALRHHSYEWD